MCKLFCMLEVQGKYDHVLVGQKSHLKCWILFTVYDFILKYITSLWSLAELGRVTLVVPWLFWNLILFFVLVGVNRILPAPGYTSPPQWPQLTALVYGVTFLWDRPAQIPFGLSSWQRIPARLCPKVLQSIAKSELNSCVSGYISASNVAF